MQYQVFIFSVLLLILFQKSIGQDSKNNSEMVIENFQKEFHLDWRIVNDGVMGGLSSSKIEIHAEGQAKFSGRVSLENYGGFASIRGLISGEKLVGIRKIEIRVKGDGKKYDFRIRTNNRFDRVSYKLEFQTKKNQWTTHEFLLSEFVPTFRGRILKNIPPIEASEIKQVGILIAGKQEGYFELILDYLKGTFKVEEKAIK